MARTVFKLPDDLPRLLELEQYPSMVVEECRPLREFIRRHYHAFDELRFEVRVGQGGQLGPDDDPKLRKAWAHITRMRLDAFGWKAPNIATLIECKQWLGNDGVWQLLSYRDAYMADEPTHRVQLVLVAEGATSTAQVLARRFGIALYLYEFPADTMPATSGIVGGSTDGV